MKKLERFFSVLLVISIFTSNYIIPEERSFHYHYLIPLLFASLIYVKQIAIGRVYIDPVLILYLIFAALCMASIFWSVDPGRTSSAAQRVMLIALILPALWLFVRSEGNLPFFINAFVGIGTVTGLIGGLVSFDTGSRTFMGMGPAPAGELYACVVLIAGLRWIATGSRWMLLAAMASCLPIFLTASIRAAVFVGTVASICIALYGIRQFIRLNLGKLSLLTSAVAAIALAVTYFHDYMQGYLFARIDRYADYLSRALLAGEPAEDVGGPAIRLTLIQAGIDLAKDTVSLFGKGLESTYHLLDEKIGTYTYTHVNSLEIIIGTGIIGFIIFHMIFIKIAIDTLNSRKIAFSEKVYLLAILAGIGVMSIAGRIYNSLPLWILIVLLCAFLRNPSSIAYKASSRIHDVQRGSANHARRADQRPASSPNR